MSSRSRSTASGSLPIGLAALALALACAGPAQASVDKWGYIPLADGTQLRYTVTLPAADGRFPVAMDYDGYCEGTGATTCNDVDMAKKLVGAGYAVLGVSMRGTGCSTGTFDFRSPQEHADGAAAVEWAAKQPWSTGRVGMFGDSFPGLSQPGVAALRPHGLAAIAPFQIVDDVYRDVAYPGGISNGEFGAFWGFGRPARGRRLGHVHGRLGAERSSVRRQLRGGPRPERAEQHRRRRRPAHVGRRVLAVQGDRRLPGREDRRPRLQLHHVAGRRGRQPSGLDAVSPH